MKSFDEKLGAIKRKITEVQAMLSGNAKTQQRRQRPYSATEDNFLRQHYADQSNAWLAEQLDRSVKGLALRARKMGLRKSPEYMSAHSGRFERGRTSWNKGKSLPSHPNPRKSQFKKGHRPHTWRPIGHERITVDGYLERKVTDTGVSRHDFVAVHRLEWEKEYGPIPDGHVVVFRSSDLLDTSPENLELISRQELMLRNSIHDFPPELTPLMAQVSRLNNAIKEVEDEHINQ